MFIKRNIIAPPPLPVNIDKIATPTALEVDRP